MLATWLAPPVCHSGSNPGALVSAVNPFTLQKCYPAHECVHDVDFTLSPQVCLRLCATLGLHIRPCRALSLGVGLRLRLQPATSHSRTLAPPRANSAPHSELGRPVRSRAQSPARMPASRPAARAPQSATAHARPQACMRACRQASTPARTRKPELSAGCAQAHTACAVPGSACVRSPPAISVTIHPTALMGRSQESRPTAVFKAAARGVAPPLPHPGLPRASLCGSAPNAGRLGAALHLATLG